MDSVSSIYCQHKHPRSHNMIQFLFWCMGHMNCMPPPAIKKTWFPCIYSRILSCKTCMRQRASAVIRTQNGHNVLISAKKNIPAWMLKRRPESRSMVCLPCGLGPYCWNLKYVRYDKKCWVPTFYPGERAEMGHWHSFQWTKKQKTRQ